MVVINWLEEFLSMLLSLFRNLIVTYANHFVPWVFRLVTIITIASTFFEPNKTALLAKGMMVIGRSPINISEFYVVNSNV